MNISDSISDASTMMPPLSQSLLAVVLLSTAVIVTRAVSVQRGKEVVPKHTKYSSLQEEARASMDKKKLRRGKRHVIYEDAVNNNEDDGDMEQAMLRQQLEQLSDDELEALADIVRNEVDRYSIPRAVSVPQYEIIEIPDEEVDDPIVEIYPRDRRSLPLDWPESEEPEYFVFPDEAMTEALRQEHDEQELRDRIAEIAEILNERATRGSRYI
ncbi:hypothetical protein KIN20_002464 [Parelaphostrongylus tenuis]|uniref:Uncharacterized protein n=1 Tax=Parelaphostrongylus tenuis TaxID=148309 RepID=A0AAD5QDJ8_PARTN|nr:hypothetical protein KIN20_002464 [Parelaphostrongylus tenuis]